MAYCRHWPEPVQDLLHHLAESKGAKTEFLTAHLAIGDARRTLINAIPADFKADAIFLDPFSPPKCPQLWTVEFLQHLGDRLSPSGRLATYCSAAAVRHGLQLAKLHIATTVDSLPTHPLRRPWGTLASHEPLDLPGLPPWEAEHLHTKAAIPYRDPKGISTPAEIIALRQAEQESSELEPTSRWKKRWLNA